MGGVSFKRCKTKPKNTTLIWTRVTPQQKTPLNTGFLNGGAEEDRTPDLLTASQALSQLSYTPATRRFYGTAILTY